MVYCGCLFICSLEIFILTLVSVSLSWFITQCICVFLYFVGIQLANYSRMLIAGISFVIVANCSCIVAETK